MTAVIKRLQTTLFANQPLDRVKDLGPEFYRQLIPSHMILNLEYSLLGQQIRANLLTPKGIDNKQLKKQLVDQLNSAISLAEIMERIYQDYLIVPREVNRFREQRQLYTEILCEIQGEAHAKKEPLPSPSLFTQNVRLETANANLYRLLYVRSKRALDLIAALDGSADWYRYLVKHVDYLADPVLPYVAWIFFIPRLSVNLFLLLKHTIPGSWMGQDEADLGWTVRLQGQLLRRWFLLGNDMAWFSVGFINCFFLSGAAATYLGITFFAYDIFLSALRVYIELSRLYALRSQYQTIGGEGIEQQLKAIEDQINFEWLQLGSHLAITLGIFLAMGCGAPVFAATPIIPVIGALSLVFYCAVNFALVPINDQARPRDVIEIPKDGVRQLGFFAQKDEGPISAKGSSTPDVASEIIPSKI